MEKEPIAVQAIKITGLRRYPQSLVQQELKKVHQAQTFGALLEEIDAATQNLNQTDLFDDVKTSIGGADAQGVHVTIHLSEKKPYKLKIGATTSGAADEVRYEAAGTLRGFLRQGELATATVTKSPKHGLELAFGLRRPVATPLAVLGLAESLVSVDVEAGGREAPWAPATSSTPGRRVDGRAVRCACAARDGSRRLVIEVARRVGVDDDAFSQSTKCALSYALRADGRDAAAAPTDGACADASVEVAGLGDAGDARFVKAEGALQNHIQLAKLKNGFVALGGVARLGAALPLFGNGVLDLAMPDRFYLGGPLRLRAFERCGVGARRAAARGRRDGSTGRRRRAALGGVAHTKRAGPGRPWEARPAGARVPRRGRAPRARRARVITVADGRDAAVLRIGPGPRAGGVRAPRAELRLGAPRPAGRRGEGAPVRRVGGVRELSTYKLYY